MTYRAAALSLNLSDIAQSFSTSPYETGSWAFWRSPEDQPAWARPALLGLTAVAGVLYSWDATSNLEVYYAATVRSMSTSWHDFFAAFDSSRDHHRRQAPRSVLDTALAVRAFGLHAWAFVAPQVVAGMASILVLYHAVRRLAGPLAGIIGAAVLVLSPATVALNRGNIPDTLMVLLLLLAADSTVTAVISGPGPQPRLAGIFVGRPSKPRC